MGAITGLDHYAQIISGGGAVYREPLFTWKDSLIDGTDTVQPTTNTGYHFSMWRHNGNPGAGAIPTTAAALSSASAGAIPFANASGGRELVLLGGNLLQFSLATLTLYDRLLHRGGLSGTVTTPQTVGGSITRYTGGEGNQIWVEIYDTVGATGTNIVASYTNQDGVSGRTTEFRTFGGTAFRELGRMMCLGLQAGDTGVRSVEDVTVAATTGTAGDFGVTIVHPLARFGGPSAAGQGAVGQNRDFVMATPSKVVIEPDACLAWLYGTGVNNVQELTVMLSVAEV